MILCCICCFISYFCYCIYYHFYYYYLFPQNLLSQKCSLKANGFILFFPLSIWKHVFFTLLFFLGTCFKIYLVAVLICYLYFIIYCRAHNIFGTLWRVLFLPSQLLVTLNVARNEIRKEIFLTFKEVLYKSIFNFFNLLFF